MGIFKPLVSRAQEVSPETSVEPTSKILTPANALTATRPLLAAEVSRRLITGQRRVTPLTFLMGCTDMEGKVARFFDEHFPEWEIGTSIWGELLDPVADTTAALMVGSAGLKSPRVSLAGKAAISIVLAQEGSKSIWAIGADKRYRNATSSAEYPRGERLKLEVDDQGKEAMAEKLWALGFAVATHDVDNPTLRNAFGAAALGMATTGAIRGERVRREYAQEVDEMIAEQLAKHGFEG